jgi:hypothetical protein
VVTDIELIEQLVSFYGPELRRQVAKGCRAEDVREELRRLSFRCARHAQRGGMPEAEVRAKLLALAAEVDVFHADTAVMAGLRRAGRRQVSA